MASIRERKRSDGTVIYHVQVRLKGNPKQTASFQSKTKARQWAQQIEAAMREGRHFISTEAKRHTVSQMIDRYIETIMPSKKDRTRTTQQTQLQWWKEKLGSLKLAAVTPARISQLRDQLAEGTTPHGHQRSSSTVNRYLAVLSHCFTVAIKDWQWISDNPVSKLRKPKEPRGRVRYLAPEERERLLQACRQSRDPYLYAIVVVAISTGMRRGEILNLTWSDLDLERGMITIQETKNDERRSVPLAGLARDVLQQLRNQSVISMSYLFPGPAGPGKTIKPRDIQSAWKTALRRAEIEDFKFHDLRHTAASYLAENGATLAEIAGVLGHKTLAMVKRYSHLSEPHTAQVVARMNEKIFGG